MCGVTLVFVNHHSRARRRRGGTWDQVHLSFQHSWWIWKLNEMVGHPTLQDSLIWGPNKVQEHYIIYIHGFGSLVRWSWGWCTTPSSPLPTSWNAPAPSLWHSCSILPSRKRARMANHSKRSAELPRVRLWRLRALGHILTLQRWRKPRDCSSDGEWGIHLIVSTCFHLVNFVINWCWPSKNNRLTFEGS